MVGWLGNPTPRKHQGGQQEVQLLSFQRKDGSWPTLLYEGPSMLCEVKKTESLSARCTTGCAAVIFAVHEL